MAGKPSKSERMVDDLISRFGKGLPEGILDSFRRAVLRDRMNKTSSYDWLYWIVFEHFRESRNVFEHHRYIDQCGREYVTAGLPKPFNLSFVDRLWVRLNQDVEIVPNYAHPDQVAAYTVTILQGSVGTIDLNCIPWHKQKGMAYTYLEGADPETGGVRHVQCPVSFSDRAVYIRWSCLEPIEQ